ncbi:MAG: 1-acyl-sn-glycerol-3-phosphate acyltransferase [Actinobacteria bacterium]|nr:1-acyl-sn-glycerol-3-phosphate acyltransferase [Actinomycetota bacterium]
MREPVEQLFPGYSRAAYRAIKTSLGAAMNRLYRVEVEGLHNVPADGSGIVAANHISFVDSLFIPMVIPRRVTYLAKAEYWDSWKTRWFFDLVGQIPVRRDDSAKALAALEAGLRVLNKGGLLGIYPEGTRSPDGCLYRGKTGVARMAAEADCPVIPVGLVGTREIMPKEAKLPNFRGAVTLRFGEPMRVSKDEVDDGPLALRTFVDSLMYEIRRLSGQEYRDEYAGKKRERVTVAA